MSMNEFRRIVGLPNNSTSNISAPNPIAPNPPSPSLIPDSQSSNQQQLTIEELLTQPGREKIPKLDPMCRGNSTWFGSKNRISKSFLKMIRALLKHPYKTWNAMPQSEKELWFRTFTQDFDWHPNLTGQVWDAFNKMAQDSYSGHMNEWKAKWQNGEEKPSNLNESVWTGLQPYWADPTTKKVAKINSENRKKNPRGTHNSGATSFLAREDEMTQQSGGVAPDLVALLKRTHTNKVTGKIDYPNIAEIVEKVEKRKEERLTQMSLSQGLDGSSSSNQCELTRDEVNNMVIEETPLRKGRRSGLGNLVSRFGPSSSSRSNPVFFDEVESLKEALEKKDEEVQELKQENAATKESLEALKAFMRSKFPDCQF